MTDLALRSPAPVAGAAPLRPALASTALRAGAAAAAVVVLGAVRIHRPVTFCPLRALTGIPCPLCGTTTAAVRLGRGNVLGALAANPVALVCGAVLIMAPLLVRHVRIPHRARPWLLTVGALFAWTWQLVRFDRLPL